MPALLPHQHTSIQGRQGLGLAWILRNRTRWRQQWHADNVAATVVALPAKNLPWRPCAQLSFWVASCQEMKQQRPDN